MDPILVDFGTFAAAMCVQQRREPPSGVSLLCLDPGHTTGWAVFLDHELQACGQISTQSVEEATKNLGALFKTYVPERVVLEDYRVYQWRAKHHAGSDLLTARVIGCIETLCSFLDVPWVKQPAQVAKNFCTNEKLKQWRFYQQAERHANDAIRHGCYYLLFGAIRKTRSTTGSHSVG